MTGTARLFGTDAVAMAHRSIAELLVERRRSVARLTPREAWLAICELDGVLIDLRDDAQRAREGEIPGAFLVARNVFEWRFACSEGGRDPRLPERDGFPIVLCGQGFQSSLAAAALVELGFTRAADVVDGFTGWREAGLPVVPYGTVPVIRAVAGGPDDPTPGAYG